MSYGMKTNVGISFQNSYGTALTNSIYWIPYLNEGFAVAKEPLISEAMTGVYDEGAHYEGLNSNDAPLEFEAHPIALGAIFKAMFGAPTSVQSGSIYAHTFKPRTSDFDTYAAGNPMTLVKDLGDSGSMHQYYDMVASKLSLSVANGEFLKGSIEFMGGKYSQVAAVAATYPTGKGWTWNVASVSLAGTANGDIKELNIELDEALENHYTLNNTKTPSRTKRSGRRTLSIGGTIVFDSQSEYQQFLSQSERNLTVNFKGSVEVQSGYTEDLRMIVPLMRYTEFKPVAGEAGKVSVGFTAKGVYSTSSATALHFVLTNTQAAY